ncbi:MAG: helix-turn-helix domain-containing protein [Spirosomataceae bacterium]
MSLFYFIITLDKFLVKSLKLYNSYKNLAYETISFADSVTFSWIQRFLIAFLMILILRGLHFVINPEWNQFGNKFWYYLCFSVLFYYISINGYINSVRSQVPLQKSVEVFTDEYPENNPSENQDTTAQLDELKKQIETIIIQQELFINPTLTLQELADKTGLHPKKLSFVINQGFGMNFNDFVNYYRTQAVISKLKSGEHNLFTLLGIAYECGFNSKSTFNRAFKKQTSITPKEYLSKMGVKS